MRASIALLTAGAAVILLSACSSAPQSGSSPGLLPTGSGVSHVGIGNLARHRLEAAPILRKLYVDESYEVEVLQYGTWNNIGTISGGLATAEGNWVDKHGNLYVANAGSPNITEYDPSGNLTFTYDAGMTTPTDVTTDKVGNVYEADNTGKVSEYAQGSNVVAATCSLPRGDFAQGVAVNRRGGVFVTFTNGTNGGIIAYPSGLNKPYACTSAQLPVLFASPIGIVFDKQGNMVVCDAFGAAVDILAPPYNAITGTLGSGWVEPVFVTIDKAASQAYVTDLAAGPSYTGVVRVLTYPGGSIVATLGSANGLAFPISAVDSKNYVP